MFSQLPASSIHFTSSASIDFDLDWEATSKEIVSFIESYVKKSQARGVVVGLSGGVDSSVVTKLSVMALGQSNVLGVLMPTNFTPQTDMEDARSLALQLGIQTRIIDIGSIDQAFGTSLGVPSGDKGMKIPFANIRARIRMTILYFFANRLNYLVAGTGDRSEDLIGYFTKYGDGGVDLLPISHLYKSQVRKLADFLGLPLKISSKPSSPQLYPGHKATDEIPADYELLDRIEKMLFDDRLSPAEVSLKCRVNGNLVDEVMRRYSSSGHKRLYPPMLREW